MGQWAARFSFVLRAYGHKKVFILDGQFGKWAGENRAVEVDQASFDYELQSDLVVGFDEVKQAEDGSRTILDTRPPNMVEAGAIPTSVNIPAGSFLSQDDKTLKSKEEIEALLKGSGVDTSKPVTLSCQAGVMAALAHAALEQTLFQEKGQAVVYDGSYSEYAQKM